MSHAGGETRFESYPERIEILDDPMHRDLLAFGVVPVRTAGAGPTVVSVCEGGRVSYRRR